MTDPKTHLIDRRTLLTEFGKGVVGVAVFGSLRTLALPDPAHGAEPVRYARANLGFVSAYVLARGKTAMVVDTGVRGSSAAIEKAVKSLGLRWDGVRHVVLTHHHGDHAGSLPDVLAKATQATAYAGAPDVANIASPRKVKPLADGDDVFGLKIIATPGHTPGHVCVYDPVGGLLVAGDALGVDGYGHVIGPNPSFTADMTEATRSVARLAKSKFGILLVGHGDPVTANASEEVARLVK